MALKIQITDARGVTTNYHKIAELKITDRIVVTLKSYADESYRDKEKTVAENIALREELTIKIAEEQAKLEPDTTVLAELTEQLNTIDTDVQDCSIGTMNYTIPFDVESEISFTGIYEQLKKEYTFEGAEDC